MSLSCQSYVLGILNFLRFSWVPSRFRFYYIIVTDYRCWSKYSSCCYVFFSCFEVVSAKKKKLLMIAHNCALLVDIWFALNCTPTYNTFVLILSVLPYQFSIHIPSTSLQKLILLTIFSFCSLTSSFILPHFTFDPI